MNTLAMDSASVERRLGKALRYLPVVVLFLLALAYLTGGFSSSSQPSLAKSIFQPLFTVFIGFGPVIFIAFLLLIEGLRRRSNKQQAANIGKLNYDNAFELPSQEMHGYKITFLTGRAPAFTGLTGDLYTSDAVAHCAPNPEHVPPVAGCECGFYAYKDIRTAEHELSINPGAFLIDVDLFGVGFSYSRGFKAESQVVNLLHLPKRCMRCKIFTPQRFVVSYKLNYNSFAYWRWEYRCGMCSYSFKEQDRLSAEQMSQALKVVLR